MFRGLLPVCFRVLLLGVLLLTWELTCVAEIIPAARRSTWVGNVGVKGGIPDSSTLPVYTNLNTSHTLAEINAAIAACPSNQVVQFGAGIFKLAGSINVMKNGVVLRGTGKTNTVLDFSAGAINVEGQGQFYGPLANGSAPQGSSDWLGGYSVGTSNITLASVSGLSVGKIICLDQLNDNDMVSSAGGEGPCNYCGRGSGTRSQLQWATVTAINGNTVTIDPPLFMGNWNSGQDPEAWWVSDAAWRHRVGIEDLTIDGMDSGGLGPYGGNIYWFGGVNCWIKNVRSLAPGQGRTHMLHYGGFRLEARDCDMIGTAGTSLSYAITPVWASSDWYENNIIDGVTGAVLPGWSASCHAFTYNFIVNNIRAEVPAWNQIGFNMHNAHGNSWLIEGNYANGYLGDFIHGSGSHITLFRNRFHGRNPGTTLLTYPIVLQSKNRFLNSVGNILGTVGYHTNYIETGDVLSQKSIYLLGWMNGQSSYDPQVAATLYAHGSYDTVNNGIVWAATNPDRTIPESLVHGTKPAWFGALKWPPYEPTNGAAIAANPTAYTNIPAGYRYVYGTNPQFGDQSPPTAPGTALATAAGTSQINVSWGAASDNVGVTGYRVERSQGAGSTAFAQIAAPSGTSFSNTGLSPGTIYNYRIRAVDAAGNLGPYSATASATTSQPAVNQPPTVNLTAPASGASGYAPTTVTLNASASDADGSVTKVEFFDGLSKIGEDTTAPYTANLNALAARDYVLTAVAHDNSGAAVLSASVVFSAVQPGISSAHRLPNGSFNIVAAGTAGRTNSVHVSSDLVTWTLLTNLVNVGGTVNLVDAEAAVLSRRFYRIWAESLFLSNVVGFARVTVPPGYSIIANQFIQPTSTVAAVITGVPGGTSLSKFRPATGDFAINNFDPIFLSWLDPNQTFANGDTGFLLNPTTNSFALTFQGQVPQGLLSLGLPSGYSMVGSRLPQAGAIQGQLGFPGASGDTVFLYRDGRYRTSQFDPLLGGWDFEPNVNVGEGFFLFKTAATNWVRSFSAFN